MPAGAATLALAGGVLAPAGLLAALLGLDAAGAGPLLLGERRVGEGWLRAERRRLGQRQEGGHLSGGGGGGGRGKKSWEGGGEGRCRRERKGWRWGEGGRRGDGRSEGGYGWWAERGRGRARGAKGGGEIASGGPHGFTAGQGGAPLGRTLRLVRSHRLSASAPLGRLHLAAVSGPTAARETSSSRCRERVRSSRARQHGQRCESALNEGDGRATGAEVGGRVRQLSSGRDRPPAGARLARRRLSSPASTTRPRPSAPFLPSLPPSQPRH